MRGSGMEHTHRKRWEMVSLPAESSERAFMVTVSAHKNPQKAKRYYEQELASDEYYLGSNNRQSGHWFGRGCKELGLSPREIVQDRIFMALCGNKSPLGAKLTVRNSPHRRVMLDFTVSAPKSVSVMAVTMGDRRIVELHQVAARKCMAELEKLAEVRVRKGSHHKTRSNRNVGATSGIVAAEFQHDTSRSLDPQLHTHFTVFNCAYDPLEKRWKALEAGRMFEGTKKATEIYRQVLSDGLLKLGYELQNSKHGFQINGVSQSVLDRFSKRAKERDVAIAERRKRVKREPSQKEISIAVRRTRKAKTKADPAQVLAAQRAQLTMEEMTLLESLKSGSHPKTGGYFEITKTEFSIELGRRKVGKHPRPRQLRRGRMRLRRVVQLLELRGVPLNRATAFALGKMATEFEKTIEDLDVEIFK